MNVLKTEGQAKVGGTLVCVSGAILMVLFRGPALLGYADNVPRQHNEISAIGQPEPAGWMFSNFESFGIDNSRGRGRDCRCLRLRKPRRSSPCWFH